MTEQGKDFAPITVNLTNRSRAALERLSKRHGDTDTDALNRAIQLADYMDLVVDEGATLMVQREPGGPIQEIKAY